MTFTFNQSFFAEHFDKFFDYFNDHDSHHESFYQNFYHEFIDDDYITDENKEKWIESWKEDFDGEIDIEDKSFTDILDENEWLIEDITYDLITDDESIKKKSIPQLFFHISEMWSEESIQDAINELKIGDSF